MEFKVAETFLSLSVADMDRAVRFYSRSLGATTSWTSPQWSSLVVAGVRIGLFFSPAHRGGRVGLHFAVTNIQAACAAVSAEGGKIVTPASQIAPGVHAAEAADTEGQHFLAAGGQLMSTAFFWFAREPNKLLQATRETRAPEQWR